MSHYFKKQVTILLIFFLILFAIGIGVYFISILQNKATCYDGIRNQTETGIDCGGPCGPCRERPDNPLGIILYDFVPTTENNFDLVAKVINPNASWGVNTVSYKFGLYDAANNLIGFKEGVTYILPQETKYIIEQRFYSAVNVASVSFELGKPQWENLKDFTELELRIRDKNYQLLGTNYRLSGNIENKSNYNLDTVEIVGLLFDENQKIIAAGKTSISTFLIGDTRYFELTWPYRADKNVVSSEARAYTNVFLDDNFMKVHATPEKFREY